MQQVVNHQQRDTVRQTLIGLGGGLLLAFLAFGNAHAADRRQDREPRIDVLRRIAAVVDDARHADPALESSLEQLRNVMARESRTARASLPEHKQRY